MFAELVINIEAPLAETFHYHVPTDMRPRLRLGHLVEVEFGRRLAQGIVTGFDEVAPVPDTKPIIAIIDPQPVVQPWQIVLARWLSQHYLAPLNACMRLLLPPGLTRWADITVAVNPMWDGSGRLTEVQKAILDLLGDNGDMRGRQLRRMLPKQYRKEWQKAVNQLAQRDILRKGSILDEPRVRPKKIRTVELSAGPRQWWDAVLKLGQHTKQSEVIYYLAQSEDPLPAEEEVIASTGATREHIDALVAAGIVQRTSPARIVTTTADRSAFPAPFTAFFDRLPASITSLAAAVGDSEAPTLADLEAMVDDLMAQGLLQVTSEPSELNLTLSRKESLEQVFRLRSGEKYHAILTLLAREAQPVSVSDVYEETGSSIYHLRRLAKQGLLRFGAIEVWRDPLADRDFVPSEPPALTADQRRAWQEIKSALDRPDGDEGTEPEKPFLLHGVTGSGKTEIYMRAIAHALDHGRRAIVLVPEIALTPQTVRRFAARFPGRVAVLHSRLSDGERYDTWRRARQGLFDIVVGPRSALFTPLPDLGVIVVDEEHDHSYKQEPPIPPPYYHAREAAIALGEITRSVVILGSATPDLVSYHRARGGKFQLLDMPRRVLGHRKRIEGQAERLQVSSRYQHEDGDPEEAVSIPLPPVQIVDLRQELRAGNRSIFSRALLAAVDDTLKRQEQAILFLNRRGTATFVLCRDCGHVLKCPRCDVPLTYHRPGAALVCHHCGRTEPPHANCPECGSHRIKYFGLGTEQLEHLVQQQWPQARIVRWDSDTTASRDSHEQLLASFINQEADILVGTQMIAKGLDLPLVTLVGVISADVLLGLPDYHIGERTFQLLTQVAGRAGRGLLGGRVIVQTYKPEHYAIQAAAEHDYVSFYLDEIRFRTQHSYPPFRRLAKLLLRDPVNERGRQKAEQLAANLRRHVREQALGATEVLGPAPPFFNRIDGRYRWQILVRSPEPARALQDFHIPRPWLLDLDPVSTL